MRLINLPTRRVLKAISLNEKSKVGNNVYAISPTFEKTDTSVKHFWMSACVQRRRTDLAAGHCSQWPPWSIDQDQPGAIGSKVAFAFSVLVLGTKKLKINYSFSSGKTKRGTLPFTLIHILMGLSYSRPTGSLPPTARTSALVLYSRLPCLLSSRAATGGDWALEMWLVQTEIDWKSKEQNSKTQYEEK